MAYTKSNTTKPQEAPVPNDQKLDKDPSGKPNQLQDPNPVLKKYEVKVRITKSGEVNYYSFYCNENIAEIYKRKIDKKKKGRKVILSVEPVK